jgi:hypothetical protein
MHQLSITLSALALAAFQMLADSLTWHLDIIGNDEIARSQARFLVWDGVPHPPAATFEKVNIVDKDWPFYLFHVVIASPGAEAARDRSSYLVCFKLSEQATEFRIVTVIQYASDPPTEIEGATDKRLNRWPVSAPWDVGDELPRKIKGSGLSIVLDNCREEFEHYPP